MKVITNYKSLKYSITTKKLMKCQAYLAQNLFSFNFIISYIPSKKNQKNKFINP